MQLYSWLKFIFTEKVKERKARMGQQEASQYMTGLATASQPIKMVMILL